MTKNGFTCVLAVALTLMSSTALLAFEPLFYVTKSSGVHTITPPNAPSDTVVWPRAYPYGSRIQTSAEGSVELDLSEHNTITIGPNATVSIREDAANRHWKFVDVENGNVHVRMADKFDRDVFGQLTSRRVTIVTPALMGDPLTGGEYGVVVTQRQDVTVCDFTATRSELRLYDGLLFDIPAIKHDHCVSATVTADKNYLRVRDVRGRFLMELKHLTDEQGNPKLVEMSPETVVKIRRRFIEQTGTWVVTTLVVDAKGKLSEEHSYRVEQGM